MIEMLLTWSRVRKAAAAALGAVAVVASAAAGTSGATSAVRPVKAASHPVAAEAFAEEVLAMAPTPPGAAPWTAALPPLLAEPGTSVAIRGLIDLHRVYVVPFQLSQSAVIRQLPVGTRVTTSGSGGGPQGFDSSFVATVPTVGPNEYLAQLVYTMTTVGVRKLLRVDAQVVWVASRSAAETIPTPATAHVTGFNLVSAAGLPTRSVTVQLGAAQSGRLAAVINSLPLGAGVMCMEDPEAYSVTFKPLNGSPQITVTGEMCGFTVEVSVGGTSRAPLHDGRCSLLRAVSAVLPASAIGTRNAAKDCAAG